MPIREFTTCRVGLLLTTILLLTGCPGTEPATPTQGAGLPYQGVEVRFAVPTGLGLAKTWAPAINDWADENDASVRIIEFDATGSVSDWLPKLASQSPSLGIIPTPLVNELVGERMVAPIPDETLDESVIGWSRIPPNLRSTLGSIAGSPAIVPVTCPTPVVCYRSDLLEAAGKTPPATWADYDRLVRDLSQWAPGHVAVEPWSDESLPTVFFARALSGAKHAAQYSVELDSTTGDPLIASAPFVTALEEMAALAPQLSADVGSMSAADCLQALADGKAAIGIVWESPGMREADRSGHGSSDRSANDNTGPLAFSPLPGRTEVYDRDTRKWVSPPTSDTNRPALCGFGGLSVCGLQPASPLEHAAAWDLWGLLETYLAEGTLPPLPGAAVTAQTGTVELSPNLSPGENQEYGRAVARNLQNPLLVCELPVCGRDELRELLLRGLRQALSGDATADAALQQTQEQWTAAIDELGRAKVLNSYRSRLGLATLPE